MGTRTISLSSEAYLRLRAHRRGAGDSFSRIVMRARWDDSAITAGELLDRGRDLPPFFNDEELLAIETAKSENLPPVDKWNSR